MKRFFKWLIAILLSFFTLLVILLSILFLLLSYNSSFVAWSLNQVRSLSANSFNYSEVTGNFSSGVKISDLHLSNASLLLQSNNVVLQGNLICLLKFDFCVDNLQIDGLNIELKKSDSSIVVAESDKLSKQSLINDLVTFIQDYISSQVGIKLNYLQVNELKVSDKNLSLQIPQIKINDLTASVKGINLSNFYSVGVVLQVEDEQALLSEEQKSVKLLESFIIWLKAWQNQAQSSSVEIEVKSQIQISNITKKLDSWLSKPISYYINAETQRILSPFHIEIQNFEIEQSTLVYKNTLQFKLDKLLTNLNHNKDLLQSKLEIKSNWFDLNFELDSTKTQIATLHLTTNKEIPISRMSKVDLDLIAVGDLNKNLAITFVANKQKDNVTILHSLAQTNVNTQDSTFWESSDDESILSGKFNVDLDKDFWPMRSLITIKALRLNNFVINSLRLSNDGDYKKNSSDLFADFKINGVSVAINSHLVGEKTNLRLNPVNISIQGKRVVSHLLEIKLTDSISFKTQNTINNLQLKPLIQVLSLKDSLPELNGIINGRMEFNLLLDDQFINGNYATSKWEATISESKITGEINRQPLSFITSGNGSQNQIVIDGFNLILGNNRIEQNLQFKLNKHLLNSAINLHSKIDISNLSIIDPHLNILVKGDLQLQGTLLHLVANGKLRAKNINYKDLSIESIDSDFAVQADKNYLTSAIVSIHGVKLPGIDVKKGDLKVIGDINNQIASIQLDSDLIQLDLDYHGKLENDKLYRGKLITKNLELNTLGKVTVANSNLIYDWEKYQLQFIPGKIDNKLFKINLYQLNFNLLDRNLNWSGDFSNLNLNLFKPFISNRSNLVGIINGKFNLLNHKGNLQLSGNISSKNINVAHEINFEPLKLGLQNVNAGFIASQQQIKINFKSKLNNKTYISADLEIDSLLQKTPQLNSTVTISNLQIEDFSSILDRSEIVKGRVDATLISKGPINDPKIFGKIELNNPLFDLNMIPFTILSGKLTTVFNGKNANISGVLRTNSNPINLIGTIDFQTLEDLTSKLNIKSNKLEVKYPLYGNFVINSNLNITADLNQMSVDGSADIVKGEIQIASLQKKPIEEVDTIIVNQNQTIDSIPSRYLVYTDIKLNINPELKIDAYNLKGNLSGNLDIRNSDFGLGLYGTIKLLNGSYKNYGQDLKVERGTFNFSGVASNPVLLVTALRNPEVTNDSVEVGVEITGSVQSPAINLFSKPSMSSEQALQYLITGTSNLNESGNASNLGLALLVSSLTSTAISVEKLGHLIGINNLHLNTSKAGDQSRLNLTGNINSRLQGTASVGIFNGLTSFSLRYSLLSRLYLETNIDTSESLYLVYRYLWD